MTPIALVPCPCCHHEVNWVGTHSIRCPQCRMLVEFALPNHVPFQLEPARAYVAGMWNAQAGQRSAELVTLLGKIPHSMEQLEAFIGSHFITSDTRGTDRSQWRYLLTLHDLHSAFAWAGLYDLDAPTT